MNQLPLRKQIATPTSSDLNAPRVELLQNEEKSKSQPLDCGHRDRDPFYACPLDVQYKEKEVFIHI